MKEANSNPPKTRIIYGELERKILSGELREGERLYSVRQIASEYNVSTAVALAAYKYLEKKKLIVREAGRGTFVRKIRKTDDSSTRICCWNGVFPINHAANVFRDPPPDFKTEFQPFFTNEYENYMEYIEFLEKAGTDNSSVPDIISVDEGLLPILGAKGLLSPLDQFLSKGKGVRREDFDEKLLQGMSYGGKLFAVPSSYSPCILFWNRKLFADKGLKEPDRNWTWNDFYKAASDMTCIAPSGQISSYGLGITFSINSYAPFIYQNGGEIFDRNGSCAIGSREACEALGFFSKLYNMPGVCSHRYGDPRSALADLMSNGNMAMLLGDAIEYHLLKGKMPENSFGMTRVPGINGRHNTSSSVTGWAIPAGSANPEKSFKLLVSAYKNGKVKNLAAAHNTFPAFKTDSETIPQVAIDLVPEISYSLQSQSPAAFNAINSTLTSFIKHKLALAPEKIREFQNKINASL